MKLRHLLYEISAYKYKKCGDKKWCYTDFEGNNMAVELIEYNILFDALELETYRIRPENNKKSYTNIETSIENRGNRGLTTAKIFKEEIIPYFKKQKKFDSLVIFPIDTYRDSFFQNIVSKNKTGNYEISEMKSGRIVIQKLRKDK